MRSILPRVGFGCSIAVVAAVFWINRGGASDDSVRSLADRFEPVLKTHGFEGAHWGLLVADAKSGETLFERDADQLFCPASVTKLFTTAAAIADLGSEFRFQTPIVREGDVDSKGVLKGNLILIAQGDPTLGGRLGPDGTLLFEDHDHSYASGNLEATIVKSDPLAGLDHLARQVHEAGIKEVAGDVLIDDRLFTPAASTGSGPSKVTPILINDNVIDFVIVAAEKVGESAQVRMVPQTSCVTLDARVETVAATESPSILVRTVGPGKVSVEGKMPLGRRPVVKIHDVADPASFARSLLIERLRNRGVNVRASHLAENNRDSLPSRAQTAALPKVAEYTSPPLKEEIRVILKVSQNLHASTLPLVVAARHGETNLRQAIRREGKNLSGLGIDISTISFGGGAGGDRADLVTPRATVALLRTMSRRADFPAFEAALPVLGRDGTLVDMVSHDSPARGHVRAKTGSYFLDNSLTGGTVLTSKAMAGYMETATGRPLVFAFFVNEVPLEIGSGGVNEAVNNAGKLLARLCEICYSDAPGSAKPQPQPQPPADSAKP